MKDDFDKVAYIVGDAYKELSALPRVLTYSQFFTAVFEQRLPLHRIWVVGQGIDKKESRLLRLCGNHSAGVRLHFVESEMENETSSSEADGITNKLIWDDFRFVEPTRAQANLLLTNFDSQQLLTQDFLFIAAKKLSERACQAIVPEGILVIKQISLQNFHRLFPLPIKAEAQFQLGNDNKRSLKCLTRFYQDYSCIAEVSLSFDLYSPEQAKQFMQELAEKTFTHFSDKMEAL